MGDPDVERERLRRTFDSVAERYDRARPTYPSTLFDRVVEVTAIQPGDQLLEVGPASGKATRALAERGFDITCIELGPELARVATRALAGFRDVRVVNAPFETWTPPPGASYELVFAATAWHWVDPEVKYQRAFGLLRPTGHLAFWSATHVFPVGGDPFFAEIQDVYDEIGEGLPAGAAQPTPDELPDERAEIEGSGLFDPVLVERFDWEITYTADEYLGLLDTFSGHLAMEPWQRDRLYGEIRRRIARRVDPVVRRHWGAVLHVARRRGAAGPLTPP